MPIPYSHELIYVALLFALFVLPRFLQRFRVPTPVTCIGLGLGAGVGLGLFQGDTTIPVLASFGIISLFLFAGMDVDFREIRRVGPFLVQHVLLLLIALFAVAYLLCVVLGLPYRPALLVALALLTPSTGFILESLNSLAVSPQERLWIRSLAIGTELVALGVLFLTLQTVSVKQFATSAAALAVLMIGVPFMFRVFAKSVVPYAPRSEFAFLLMVAVVAAYVTRELGVYYLVGAFVVGIAARRFQSRLPSLTSENMLHAVEVFASFFIPFYFFSAGLHVHRGDLSGWLVVYGVAFVLLVIPLRLLLLAVHRRYAFGESWTSTLRISAAVIPTLVFSLVIAEILRDRFGISSALYGGLVLYALLNTLLPSFVVRTPVQELDTAKAVTDPEPIAVVLDRGALDGQVPASVPVNKHTVK